MPIAKYLITYTVYTPRVIGRGVTTGGEAERPRTTTISEDPVDWYDRCGWTNDRYTDSTCVINMIHEVKNERQ